MTDCMETIKYMQERKRMCERNQCYECPLGIKSNATHKTCRAFENDYPSVTIEAVQQWSNKHPKKTLLIEFLKNYPKTDLKNGLPPICAETLGLVDKECRHEFNECYMDCRECWNTPIRDSESEECK